MTESEQPEHFGRRLDLRRLADPDAVDGAAARIVAAGTRRFSEQRAERTGVEAVLFRMRRPTLAAAAIAIAIALGAAMRMERSPSVPGAEALLARWVESNQVPTNGELLMTFQGYVR